MRCGHARNGVLLHRASCGNPEGTETFWDTGREKDSASYAPTLSGIRKREGVGCPAGYRRLPGSSADRFGGDYICLFKNAHPNVAYQGTDCSEGVIPGTLIIRTCRSLWLPRML
ncbi:MAG: hypothetical protein ACLUGJ_11665 [Blautia wexlerae]